MSYCVKDVMEMTGSCQGVVNSWILKGYLKAEKSGDRKSYVIEERDLMAFMSSDHYHGHPEDILYNRMFSKIPMIEDCYPMNLLAAIMNMTVPDAMYEPDGKLDIWDVHIARFKAVIATRLTDKEQRVLQMRYQFGLTLDECAKALNLTKERIRQIQIKAERKLRGIIHGCRTIPKKEYDILNDRYEMLKNENEKLKVKLSRYSNELPVKEEEKGIDFYTIGIEQLDLTVRSYHCLMRAGITTIGDAIEFDTSQEEDGHFPSKTWYEIRNLGRRSLMEIAKKIYEYAGYRIRKYNKQTHRFDGMIPLLESEDCVIGGVDYGVKEDPS